jgi:hypothetical protein
VKKYGLIPEEFDTQVVSREDKQKAKKIIEIIFEKIKYHSSFLGPKQSGIKLFFGPAIANAIPGKDPWSTTVTERIMKYLSVIAKIHQDSRPRLVNKETGAFYIIPTFEDLRTVLDLINKAGSNVRPYQAEWHEKIFVPAIEDMRGNPKEYWEDGQLIEKEIHIGLNRGGFC